MLSPFPLPLTPVEQFFVLDDLPGYPNLITCRLRFEGVIDREKLDSAFDELFTRHLMFYARLSPERGKPKWVYQAAAGKHVQWMEMADGDEFPAMEKLDLRSGFAYRVIVVERPSSCDLILQTHHAVVDGVGGLRAIQELLQLYARQFAGSDSSRLKLWQLDDQLLRSRGKHLTGLSKTIKQLPGQMIGLFGALKYVLRKASPLAAVDHSAPSAKDAAQVPQYVTHLFSLEESERLRRAATAEDVTINGILTRDLFLAIRDWQDHYEVSRSKRVLRLMIPINMRTVADRRRGAANRVSVVYLDRNDKQMRDPGELLWGVNFEIKTVQRLNLGMTFLMMMRLVRRIPGQLRREVSAKRCRSTAILTNLGEPFARMPFATDDDGRLIIGNVTLNSFDLLAPLRPLTAAAISIFRYAGKTGITLNYDPRALSRGQAEGLVRRYANKIARSISTTTSPDQSPSDPDSAQSGAPTPSKSFD